MISYTDSYRTTRRKRMLVALKSYPMSPFIEHVHMDELIKDIYQAKDQIDADIRF
jgi:L-2,4-diaminobutyrate decarboxylase